MRSHGNGHHSSADETLALLALNKPGGSATLLAILQNRVQTLNTTGGTVAGGGNLAPPATLTMIASGKLRITVNGSFQCSVGFATGIVSVVVAGGLTVLKWSFQEQAGISAGAANVSQSTTFELDTAATPGQTVEVFYTTTVGDNNVLQSV